MIPEFSVVIPTYQQPALLLKCLDALSRQRLPRNQFELIIVDDANSPETASAVANFTRQVAQSGGALEIRYLGQPTWRGPAAARNRGWRAARGRFIAFTDDDCLPHPDWLRAALPGLQRGAQVLMGQLRLTLPDPSTDQPSQTLCFDTGELISANCFCRRSALERVGGFEEAFNFAWREDSDLQFKFIQAGIPISRCPEAIVVHPMREMPWYTPLANERKNYYDALLYKRHPELFRQRIATDRGLILQYYASVMGIAAGVMGGVAGNSVVATVGFGIWGALSANMIWHRLLDDNEDKPRLPYAILTALATPFLSVYWRLYGAVKYRVLYW
ncbi:glycosyltransferase [Spirosoma taeanense]|uniref:Glycosyltransferase n=1 Tax=Spirosoma taeanense TaxID=2735870 RepID=A0A6M5Y120_9BACT|nr:glycosyltransferase [Spirosoma taeanense]QJW88458.1 glycosyltransferase [Spirosoma taeanense]